MDEKQVEKQPKHLTIVNSVQELHLAVGSLRSFVKKVKGELSSDEGTKETAPTPSLENVLNGTSPEIREIVDSIYKLITELHIALFG